ncbi:hypothetical protein [Thermasporomyces composti]|jgi:hypothetical protein|uniref:hypothetical protein n=1 Tax=Thermasporomyces composti TaxID=696763 RepID=UPI000E24C87C|nr:hypothetical protein [Thermasporomyces composti]
MPEDRQPVTSAVRREVVQAPRYVPVACQTAHSWADPEADETHCRSCGAIRYIVERWDETDDE